MEWRGMARNGSEPSNLLGQLPFQGGFADRPASYWSKWVCLRVCVSTLCLESCRASAPPPLSLSTYMSSVLSLNTLLSPVMTGSRHSTIKKPGLRDNIRRTMPNPIGPERRLQVFSNKGFFRDEAGFFFPKKVVKLCERIRETVDLRNYPVFKRFLKIENDSMFSCVNTSND